MTGEKIGDSGAERRRFRYRAQHEPSCTTCVKNHLANCRQGTQSALTRAEVSGGGTQAVAPEGHRPRPSGYHPLSAVDPRRHRASRPKPRSYSYSLNKKVKRLAMLKSALSAKAAAGEIIVVDGLDMGEIKTKNFVRLPQCNRGNRQEPGRYPRRFDVNVVKSARNVPGVRTTIASTLNVYEILNADKSWSSTRQHLQKIRGGVRIMKFAYDIIMQSDHHRALHDGCTGQEVRLRGRC